MKQTENEILNKQKKLLVPSAKTCDFERKIHHELHKNRRKILQNTFLDKEKKIGFV